MVNDDTGRTEIADAATQAITVQRVAVRVPPFYEQMPEIWFKQIESQFMLSGIKDDSTKFNIAIAEMNGPILHQISDAVLNPPIANKYEHFKAKVLDRFSMSEQKKIKKLLSEFTLGDRLPSHLLEEMRQHATKGVGEDLLRTLWLDCLPQNVRGILAASEGDLTAQAKLADKVMEVHDNRSNISQIKSQENNRIAELEKKVDELTKLLERSINNNRSTSRSRSRSAANRDKAHCWYHQRFGEKATKCVKPCTYQNDLN